MNYDHQPFFCEENVHRLLEKGIEETRDLHAVFVSNALRGCPLLYQNAGHGKEGLVLWDYHVFAMGRDQKQIWRVFDLDSTLPFGEAARVYLEQTFALEHPDAATLFRMIRQREYLDKFYSDRSHLLNETGEPLHPFPPWPAIICGDSSFLEIFLPDDDGLSLKELKSFLI